MYSLKDLEKICKNCKKCRLHENRNEVVFGDGNSKSDILIVGEGPGFNEDKQGKPFVGRAGQLLDKMLKAINLNRKEVYITNIVKCRPPDNRNPQESEIEKCLPYLRWQVKIIQPKIIVSLGSVSAKVLIDKNIKVGLLKTGVKNYTLYNKEEVKEKFGVFPKRMNDFKALKGDSSDNIPGAKGIGKVTATKLLNKFENIEEIYKALEREETKDISKRIQTLLKKHKEKVFLSKELVTIKKDIDLDFKLEKAKLEYDKDKVLDMFKKYNFKNLIKRFNKEEQKKTLKMF